MQGAPTDTSAAESLSRDLAQEMPSPYCPGRSIASCPSGLARELEDDIYQAALAGQSREEIEATLVSRFGRSKMGYEQSTEVFVVVTLLALAAVAAIVTLGRRWAARGAQAVPAASTSDAATGSAQRLSQDELDDLEDDLDALDGI